ncbi:hypothetical protein WDV76_07930 [Xenorhabdus griffiniae]|uniref:hypothetical protein n=1 Tax=Xenorhabdus griffiniae TaxID=351672 RepID=UPI00235922B3|nr:hypothetical protein [Xenorhabdus griffiniae]MDC9604267.1 hypothetical protein [Xenorhabdus griffiniae]
MAMQTLLFPAVGNGTRVSIFFQRVSQYYYFVQLKESSTGRPFFTWNYQSPDYGIASSFAYDGAPGDLICTVDCPQSPRLDNTWAENIITPNPESPTYGTVYNVAFNDYSGPTQFSNFFISLASWLPVSPIVPVPPIPI